MSRWTLLVAVLAAIQAPLSPPLRLHSLQSRIFHNTRTLRVLLPPGYDAPENRTRRYPVLYLNDGQNLFDSATAIFGPMEWKVDETVAQLIASRQLPALIVVGIDNAGRRGRAHEYLPYPDEYLSPPDPAPEGKRYPDFLVDEVMPFIQSHYRVSRGPDHTALGGSSYGALIALYTVQVRPNIFGRLLLESPSLYVDSGHVLRDAARTTTWPKRISLGVGTNENGKPTCDPTVITESDIVTDVASLDSLLRSLPSAPAVQVAIEPCGQHNEAAWARRLPAALQFLYQVP